MQSENTNRPWVRVVIVNYNSGNMLAACVDKLASQTMRDFEVVIVDNASLDGSADTLSLPDERFRLLRSPSNIGFAGANNLGATGCSAPWIATLNPDTEARPDMLTELRRGTERYPDARVFGATLLEAEDPTIADGFGDALSIAGIVWRAGHGQRVADLPKADTEVFSPCAAAALYARGCFENEGGFDELFFCYIEDVDLGFRLRLGGERCMQLREAIVLHHGSATTGRNSDFTLYHSFRNRLWMMLKDLPLALLLVAIPANILVSLILLARPSTGIRSRAALKGLLHGLCPPAALFRKRRIVQSRRRVSAATVARMLTWDLPRRRTKAAHSTPEWT